MLSYYPDKICILVQSAKWTNKAVNMHDNLSFTMSSTLVSQVLSLKLNTHSVDNSTLVKFFYLRKIVQTILRIFLSRKQTRILAITCNKCKQTGLNQYS